MAVLDVQNLTLSFGEKTLFSNVSFDIKEKEKVGLIGCNGAGKTSINTGNGKPSRKETSGKKPVDGNTVEKKAEAAGVLETGKADSKASELQAKQPKKQGFFQRLFGRKNGGSK